MVGHETIGENSHRQPFAGKRKKLEEFPIIVWSMKHHRVPVAAIHHVVTDVARGCPCRSWHGQIVARGRREKGTFYFPLPVQAHPEIGSDNLPIISHQMTEEEKLNVPFSRAFLADGVCEKGTLNFSLRRRGRENRESLPPVPHLPIAGERKVECPLFNGELEPSRRRRAWTTRRSLLPSA